MRAIKSARAAAKRPRRSAARSAAVCSATPSPAIERGGVPMTARKASAEKPKASAAKSAEPNEREGNRTAARAYDAAQRKFVTEGEVEKKAREAEEALDGPEGDALRRAEEAGKSRSQGEDPLLGSIKRERKDD